MTKAKIALVVPSLSEGGGVPAVARFVKEAIQRSGEYEFQLVSLATSARDECSSRLFKPKSWLKGLKTRVGTWEGEPYTHVGAEMVEFEFLRYLPRAALRQLLSECDVIHVIAGSSAWGVAVSNANKPVVLHVATRALVERRRRERISSGPAAWWRWCMTRVTNRLDDRGLRSSNMVLVMNRWMEQYALRVTGIDSSVRYAPPGVDARFFSPAIGVNRNDPNHRYILSVSRFDDPRKNIEMLLHAFAQVRRQVADPVRLRLAGASAPGQRFLRMVDELGLSEVVSFYLKPTRAELASFYRGALCFALPSDEEGFGIVVTEAMACGVPVVSTRSGGPDGIISDGLDGYLVPTGDPETMADRIVRLAEDHELNQTLGMNARKTVESRFTQEIAAAVFIDSYRMLLGKTKA